MAYLGDERDVEFTLFEHIKIQDLKKYPAFENFGEEDFRIILKEAFKFANKEISPLNSTSDEKGAKLIDGVVVTSPGFKEAYAAYAANGFIGIDASPEHGGQGLPVSLSMGIGEYFGGSCTSFMMFPGLTHGATQVIEELAPREIADLYCKKMYSGEWTGTMCLTEPQAGSGLGDIKTTAKKTDQGYLIKGGKIFISCGDNDFSSNVVHLVLARVEGDPAGTKGISLFVVPKIRVNADGSLGESNDVRIVNLEKKMGIHGSPTCTIAFGDHNQCYGVMIGEQRKGLAYMFQMMNEARLLTGMQGMSIAGNALGHAIAYSKERVQGGDVIINYPDVRRMLITMKAYVEGLRALIYQVGYYIDLEKHETDPEKKEYYQGFVELLTPICKSFASDKGFDVAVQAMQVYGGYGYISEYPIEQMVRDAKISSIYEGTNGIQAMDLLGRKLTMKGGQLFRNFYEKLDQFSQSHASNPAFGKEFESFRKSLETLGKTAMKLAEYGMSGNTQVALLQAVPFLQLTSYITLGWLLLEQALIALPKLEAIWADAKADTEEKKSAVCENNPEARFYESKIKTVRFYIWNILPQITGFSRGILSEDSSALKIRF